ncbi:pirin family protein [Saccharibacillus sp. CPCC 101409]|uniref:pirin family protein n=1 Tax=Saccharibacillus sp. CPCC 101409 TaxID=3058041 RepID=UPI00267163EF|nr:pirin family protein [Saccharibacillus sp. CPCC 101409]MDO3408325.1 pirin family protein [Saccharibacillus sp. CPCC 101409]
MINVYPASSRFEYDKGWLKGGHSFSFADYYDPENVKFGPMRVCNDDVIAPGKGFGAHPHSDMEILSIILSGKLRHEDSLGNVAVTGFGGVQRMSAGTGVIHTEHNPSEHEDVHILQLWFEPLERGKAPSYTTGEFDTAALDGALVPIASGRGLEGVTAMGQDMTVYLSRLEARQVLDFKQAVGRRIFLFVIEGELEAAGAGETVKLGRRDTARIVDAPELSLVGGAPVFYMLIDLP